eukprot:TRINITY_DN16556_c0_g1_i3.p1 TRINITY_DN16556_c0_g1~~TRINITY_DN16556_c0_g1_i3.p1  ORF type:complete len:140 (-),score=20.24 TRINITY_DN16556_c0_g1_i3:106-525(-)
MQPTGDYAITLERTEEAEPLGVTIVATCDQTYLVVEMQQNGLIPAWNCAHVEVRQRMVDLGDRILVVNGVFGNVGRMKEQFEKEVMVCVLKKGETETCGPGTNLGFDTRWWTPLTATDEGMDDGSLLLPGGSCVGDALQ